MAIIRPKVAKAGFLPVTVKMITWIANGLLVAGLWGVSNRWRPGFLLQLAGNIFWGVTAAARGDIPLTALCAVLIALCIRGFLKWGNTP